MVNDAIAAVGLPSEGLAQLAGELNLPQLAEAETARACESLKAADAIQGLQHHLGAHPDRKAVVVYPTPWGFLGRRVFDAALKTPQPVPAATLVRRTLDFWLSYHAALLELTRQQPARYIVVNGERPAASDAVAALMDQRFRERRAPGRGIAPRDRTAAHRYGNIAYQLVEAVSPACLETYAALESCADLFGRQPEFAVAATSRQDGYINDLVGLMANLGSLQSEVEMCTLQLRQIQEEWEYIWEHTRRNEEQLARLRQWVEYRSMPLMGRARLKAQASRKAISRSLAAAMSPGKWLDWAGGRRRALTAQAEAVRASGLFDEVWYLRTYPDVARSGLDSVQHYLRFGAAEGRNPSALFDTQWYLDSYPDVAEARLNPLVHYIQSGRSEGRKPSRPTR